MLFHVFLGRIGRDRLVGMVRGITCRGGTDQDHPSVARGMTFEGILAMVRNQGMLTQRPLRLRKILLMPLALYEEENNLSEWSFTGGMGQRPRQDASLTVA